MFKNYLSLVKFSHTIFAMPFALIGLFLAYRIYPSNFSWKLLALVILCMVFARNAAMSFNRYIDRYIDKLNPRTANREIPANIISTKSTLFFLVINSIFFVVTTYFINSLCFYLSFVALFVILGYSYSKRFTYLCHIILGISLSLAPIGAYIAITGHFDVKPILLSLSVLFWVSGFDIIYSLQDIEFDRKMSLKSIPSKLGYNNGRFLAIGFHLLSILFLSYFVFIYNAFFLVGYIVFAILIFYQHYIVYKHGLSKINLAFMTFNGIASILFAVFFIIDIVLFN